MSGRGASYDREFDRWDEYRRLWYLQDATNECFVYENGMILSESGATVRASTSPTARGARPAGSPGYGTSPVTRPGSNYGTSPGTGSGYAYSMEPSSGQASGSAVNALTGALAGTTLGHRRQIDSVITSVFKPQPPDSSFFKLYRVFAMEASQPAGADMTAALSNLSVPADAISVSNVLRFVVITEARSNEEFCWALPISSYRGYGVSHPTVLKREHGIVHTGRDPPSASAAERPARGEEGMLPNAIRVEAHLPHLKLHPMSRVDYGSPKRIALSVPVYEIGVVHRDSHAHLVAQYRLVLNRRSHTTQQSGTAGPRARDRSSDSRSDPMPSQDLRRRGPSSQSGSTSCLPPQPLADSAVEAMQMQAAYRRMREQRTARATVLEDLTRQYRTLHVAYSWDEAARYVRCLLNLSAGQIEAMRA